MKKDYRDLYAMGIITVLVLILMPVIIWWWNFTLTAPFEAVKNETVSVETVQDEKEKDVLDWEDVYEMNKQTVLIPVKSIRLTEGNQEYYFLRNNDGSLYISENQQLEHDKNYILEVDRITDEIVEIRFDLEFEFDEVDEDIFDEWYHNDIEQGKMMLNKYLGIETYTEISI